MKYLYWFLAVLVVAFGAYWLSAKPASAPENLRLLMVQDTEDLNFFFDIAEEKGIFAKNGIKLERVFSSGNQPEILLGGGADVYAGTLPVMLAPFYNGADLKMIASLFDPTSFFVLSRFSKEEAFKIKNVAVTTPSPTSKIIIEAALRSFGVDPSSVKYQTVPGNAPKEKLLSEEKLDFTTVSSEDFVFKSGAYEKYTVLPPAEFLSESGISWSLIVPGKILNEKREVLERFVKAVKESSLYIKGNPKEVEAYLEGKGYSSERAKAFYERLAVAGLDREMTPSLDRIRPLAERTIQIAEPNSPDRRLEDFIYSGFIK